MLNKSLCTAPTFTLAFPWASVVTLARAVHGAGPVGNRLHTSVVNVWFGIVPLKVIVASAAFITILPLPGAWPVVCWIPAVIVPAGSNADWKLLPAVSVPVAPKSTPLVCTSWNCPVIVPFSAKVKLAFASPAALVVSEAILLQLSRFGFACG
jgi:hypothetical protein